MSRPDRNASDLLGDAPPPYATVVFDCDSTLSAMEGIEELAGPEHRAALAEWTDAAMAGGVPLEEVYGRRLELVRPGRADAERIGRLYVERVLPGARELVADLRSLGKRVWIVSGGLLPAVRLLARALAIPEDHVRAVDLVLDGSGAYAGFDEDSPLARAGGKVDVLGEVRRLAPGPCAFVGDGATDLEAAHVVDRFVAYGGVVARPAVLAAARTTCTEPDLAALAPLLLSPAEIARLRDR